MWNANRCSIAKVTFCLHLIYQIHFALLLNKAKVAHHQLNSKHLLSPSTEMPCLYPNHKISLSSISITHKHPPKLWLPNSLAFRFKTNVFTKQITLNNFSNDPNFGQTITPPILLLFLISTTVIDTWSLCFSMFSVILMSWFGIGSIWRNCGSLFHHKELITRLMGLHYMCAGSIFVEKWNHLMGVSFSLFILTLPWTHTFPFYIFVWSTTMQTKQLTNFNSHTHNRIIYCFISFDNNKHLWNSKQGMLPSLIRTNWLFPQCNWTFTCTVLDWHQSTLYTPQPNFDT